MAGRHALPAPDRSTRRSVARVARPQVARSTYIDRPAPVLRPLPAVTPVVDAAVAKHVRRSVSAKRVALVVAPVLALSTLTLAGPANADTLGSASAATGSSTAGQSYHVARDIVVPVIDNGEITSSVVSYPAVVVNGGATAAQAQAALGSALSAGGKRAQLLQTALTYLGDPYVEGGASHSGIDCSGLVMVAYASVGISLAHYVPTQDAAATTIPESEAQPGDLVVYDSEAHVGLYLGDGLVLQAPHPGEPVDIIPMFSAAHHFARILPAGE